MIDAAIGLDRAMGLEDRLSSAVAFEDGGGVGVVDPFVSAAIAEGERAAEGADVRRAVPMRVGRGWLLAAGGVAAGVAAAVWMPAVGLLSSESRLAREAAIQRVSIEREKAQEAEEAIAALRASLAAQEEARRSGDDGERAREATSAQMEALRRIEDALRSGDVSAAEARREAAGVLEQAAREERSRGELDRLESDALRERLAESARRAAGLERTEERFPEESALREALRRGAFGDAAEAAERLADRAESMDDAERERLAESPRDLAEALRESGAAMDGG